MFNKLVEKKVIDSSFRPPRIRFVTSIAGLEFLETNAFSFSNDIRYGRTLLHYALSKEAVQFLLRHIPTTELLRTLHLPPARVLRWTLELDESFRKQFSFKHLLTRKRPENDLLYVQLMRDFNYSNTIDVLDIFKKENTTSSSWSFDFSFSSTPKASPTDNSGKEELYFIDEELLCAMYTFRYITADLPQQIRLVDLEKNYFLWKPHTHKYFPRTTRDFVRFVLKIFVRACPNLPKDVRILLVEKVMFKDIEAENRINFFGQSNFVFELQRDVIDVDPEQTTLCPSCTLRMVGGSCENLDCLRRATLQSQNVSWSEWN